VRPLLDGLDGTTLQSLRGDLQRAALKALGVASRCRQPHVRDGFSRLASVGLFDMAHLDELDEVATAALYASAMHKNVRASRRETRVSSALDEASLALRTRMFACASHTLDDVPKARRTLDEVRAGKGYLDRANDLVALASLYRTYPELVKLDGKKFRETDAAEAMRLAGEIFRGLGRRDPTVEGIDWHDQQRRVWTLLVTRYRAIRRWGMALFPDEADALFPDLVAASRSAWGTRRRKKPNAPEPPTPG
jgi:hypothetical protein